MENHLDYINMLKILIGKFETGPREQVGAAPTQDLVDWLNGSMDLFCNAKEWLQIVGAVEAVDSKPDPLLWEKMAKHARTLATILCRVSELEGSLRPSNPAAFQESFLQWSWTEKISQLPQESAVLHDAGGLQAANLDEKLSQARLKLSQATKNMHWPDTEDSWKADLAKDAQLEDVLAISNYQQVRKVFAGIHYIYIWHLTYDIY